MSEFPSKFVEIARSAVRCNACFEPGRLTRPILSLAQPRWIGSKYGAAPFKVAIVGLNPGAGSAAHDAANQEALGLIRAFGESGAGLEAVLEHQRRDMPMWGRPVGRYVRFYFEGLGLDLDEVALLNIAWCASKGDKYPKWMLSTCFHAHTVPLLEALAPDVVLLSGASTHAFANQVRSRLPDVRCIEAMHYAHREGASAEAEELARLRALLQAEREARSAVFGRENKSSSCDGVRHAQLVASLSGVAELAVVRQSGACSISNDRDLQGRTYRIGSRPARRLKDHNEVTWRRLVQLLAEVGVATHAELSRVATGHVSGDATKPKPEHFIDYCIRNKWLVPCE